MGSPGSIGTGQLGRTTLTSVVVHGPGDVVGLLVAPAAEHWATAASYQVPLVAVLLERPGDDEVVDAVLRGADAVVSAHDEPEELVAAVAAVAAGDTVLSPRQVRWV